MVYWNSCTIAAWWPVSHDEENSTTMSCTDNSTMVDFDMTGSGWNTDDPMRTDGTRVVWLPSTSSHLKGEYHHGVFVFFVDRENATGQTMWENERKRETTKGTSRKHLLLVRRSLCIPSLENRKKRERLVCLLVDKPGATRISCFFVRIRKKTSSFVGSMSRIVVRALSASDLIRAAYCCVTLLSRLERIGMPRKDLVVFDERID